MKFFSHKSTRKRIRAMQSEIYFAREQIRLTKFGQCDPAPYTADEWVEIMEKRISLAEELLNEAERML